MKKFKISEEEKNQILESHNSFRDVLMGHLFDKNLMTEQQALTAPEANPAGIHRTNESPSRCSEKM